MLWVILSFATAFFESLKDVFNKKSLKQVDEYVIAWYFKLFALPILAILLIFVGIPNVDKGFWPVFFLSAVLNVISSIFYAKALKYSELSISIPILAFTPVFLIFTSTMMLGEFPGIYGSLGILLIVMGSYVLHMKDSKKGFMQPFRNLIKDRGAKFMLGVALIWSITANLDKMAITNSSPIFYLCLIQLFFVIVVFPIFIKRNKNIRDHLHFIIPASFCSVAALTAQTYAFTMAIVPFVISIKRLSLLLGVIWGYYIFKEKGIKERLVGSIIMLVGVLIIVLAG